MQPSIALSATPTPKRVGVFIRVSTTMQREQEAPEVHEQRGRDYAKMRGWEVSMSLV